MLSVVLSDTCGRADDLLLIMLLLFSFRACDSGFKRNNKRNEFGT